MMNFQELQRQLRTLLESSQEQARLLFEEQRTDYALTVRRLTVDTALRWTKLMESNPRRVAVAFYEIAGANVCRLAPKEMTLTSQAAAAMVGIPLRVAGSVEFRKPYLYTGEWYAMVDAGTPYDLIVAEWSRPTAEGAETMVEED